MKMETEPKRWSNAELVSALRYIADSPPPEHGGFNPQTVLIAREAIREIGALRNALLMYHEAWNGHERDWREAMRIASKQAEFALHGGDAYGN